MNQTTIAYLLLAAAVLGEVIGTTTLKATEGFTKFVPSLVVIVAYSAAFYLMAQTLKTMPVGIAYAIWCAFGIVLIALAGWLLYRQALDMPAILGMALIMAGVMVINLFSKTIQH